MKHINNMVGLVLGLFLLSAVSNAWGASTISGPLQFTERWGSNTLGGIPEGDRVEVTATVTSDASPVAVTATQGAVTITLRSFGLLDVTQPSAFGILIPFEPSLLGSWNIVVTDSSGSTNSRLTNPIVRTEFVPLVENLVVTGPGTTPTLTWTLPNLTGFTIDRTQIRAWEVDTNFEIFRRSVIGTPTNFTIPADALPGS